MRRHFIFIISLWVNICLAQNNFQVLGKVVNEDTKIPVASASIYIKDKFIGTVSNTDGMFYLNIPSYVKKDSIVISCIGYKKATNSIDFFSSQNNIIKLVPDIIMLNETIVIPSDSALSILEKSLKGMISNLRSDPFETEGFYREELKQNNKYVGFAEAIFRAHNEGYNLIYSKEKYRYFPPGWIIIDNIRVSDFKIIFNGSGYPRYNIAINSLLFYEHNFILKKLLSKKWRKAQNFEYKSIAYQNGETLFVFSFEPKSNKSKKSRFNTGKIYMSGSDYKILKLEFSSNNKNIIIQPFTLYQKKYLNQNLTFNFVEINNTSYLSNCFNEVRYLSFKWDSLSKPDTLFSKIEFYINNIDSIQYDDKAIQEKYGSPISYFDDIRYLTNSDINDKPFNYNKSFWDNLPQSNTNPNADQINRDLSKPGRSLLNQFITNKGQIILSEESIHYLYKHYNKKSSYYAKSYKAALLYVK